ncbi:MAG: response regulator [Planctomycetota bacterium]
MSSPASARPVDVLLAEDNPADAHLMQRMLGKLRTPTRLHIVRDGEQAVRFLRRQGEYTDAPRPDLVLLDVNMPRKTGLEVLAETKADDDLRSIPVIMLTSSCAERDVEESYRLHANCFITKPVDLQRFTGLVHAFEEFWLRTVELPRTSAA